jgi:hypothetical protein
LAPVSDVIDCFADVKARAIAFTLNHPSAVLPLAKGKAPSPWRPKAVRKTISSGSDPWIHGPESLEILQLEYKLTL